MFKLLRKRPSREPSSVDRRNVLRLGGMAAAGAAGAAVASTVGASAAHANTGDPLLLGEGNGAGKAGTSLLGGVPGVPAFSASNGFQGPGLEGVGSPGVVAQGGEIGVHAMGHYALLVEGIAAFLGPVQPLAGFEGRTAFQRSGAVTLTVPSRSIVVTVPGPLTAESNVLATVQSATPVGVRSAVPHLTGLTAQTSPITIHFTELAPKGTRVAWFVFEAMP